VRVRGWGRSGAAGGTARAAACRVHRAPGARCGVPRLCCFVLLRLCVFLPAPLPALRVPSGLPCVSSSLSVPLLTPRVFPPCAHLHAPCMLLRPRAWPRAVRDPWEPCMYPHSCMHALRVLPLLPNAASLMHTPHLRAWCARGVYAPKPSVVGCRAYLSSSLPSEACACTSMHSFRSGVQSSAYAWIFHPKWCSQQGREVVLPLCCVL